MMTQSSEVISVLKKQLKGAGLTYRNVAEALNLSEASIKRMFASQAISLQRLETISELVGLSLPELFQLLNHSQQNITQLTLEQEQTVASDLELILVAVSVINGFSYQELITHYDISEALCVRKLAQLDRLDIIELLPGNRIRLKVSPNFHWLPNGPIQRFFQEKVEKDFFSSRFDRESENLMVLNGIFTPETNAELQKRMNRWSREFNELMQRDSIIPMENRKGTTLVLALREWQYSLFKQHARSSSAKKSSV